MGARNRRGEEGESSNKNEKKQGTGIGFLEGGGKKEKGEKSEKKKAQSSGKSVRMCRGSRGPKNGRGPPGKNGGRRKGDWHIKRFCVGKRDRPKEGWSSVLKHGKLVCGGRNITLKKKGGSLWETGTLEVIG